MTAFYDNAIALADRLILKYGRPITVSHVIDGTVSNPSQPWNSTPVDPVNCPTVGVFTAFDRKSIDGLNIKATDWKLIFTSTKLTFEVSTRDSVIDSLYGGMQIVSVQLIQPGSQKVLYTLQVRRG